MPEKLHQVPQSSRDAFQTVGKTVGKYRILDGLALGGMAEIYLARVLGIEGFEKYVVIKQIQPRLAKDPKFVEMFLNEARLAAQLQHQNIGQVYDIGEDGGLYYFAMEYLHGHDVRALIENSRQKKVHVPFEHALTVIAGAAAGLQYAHEKRDSSGKPLEIIHRDVSPSNIFVTYDGGIKLVDFGLARVASEGPQPQRARTVKGKSAYLSPEQCRGEPLDRRSDIFSLGIVLYELTTGTRLFRTDDNATDHAIMNRIIKGEIPLPSTLVDGYPRTLEDVVLQALAVDRDKRHPTAKALLLDLEAVARTSGLSLSTTALARYLEDTFGRKPEPWRNLKTRFKDEDESAAAASGGDDDEDDDAPRPDEFEEEVATTLYTGNSEDLKDAWAAEALAPGIRASSQSIPRLSTRRLALPLQAEDSDEIENPLVEVVGNEALESSDSATDDAPPGGHGSSGMDASSRDAITAPGQNSRRAFSEPGPMIDMTPSSDIYARLPSEANHYAQPKTYSMWILWLVLAVAALVVAALLLT